MPAKKDSYVKFSDKLTESLDDITGMINQHKGMIDTIQEVALELTSAIGTLNSLTVRYAGKANEILDILLPVIKKIHAAGKGVIGMKLIGEGDFRDSDEKINRSLEYALNLGCVDNVVVGFESEAEIDNYQQRMRDTERKTA